MPFLIFLCSVVKLFHYLTPSISTKTFQFSIFFLILLHKNRIFSLKTCKRQCKLLHNKFNKSKTNDHITFHCNLLDNLWVEKVSDVQRRTFDGSLRDNICVLNGNYVRTTDFSCERIIDEIARDLRYVVKTSSVLERKL